MKGGVAVATFEAAYEERFGFKPVIQVPDAVQLQRAYKIAGEAFADLARFFLNKEDRFLEAHGYAGRMLGAPIINAWKLSQAKPRPPQRQQTGPSYAEKLRQWTEENLSDSTPSLPPLAPLPPARTDG